MREWDQMIARQVSADGVRTAWGEHMPAEPVTTDDSIILSAEVMTKWRDGYKVEGWTHEEGTLRPREDTDG